MEILEQIMPYLISIISAFTAFMIAFFNSKRAKKDFETKLSEERTKNLELEVKKVELETLLYDNSFIICPNCESKIYAKDMIFYNQKKKEDTYEISQ